MIGHVVIEPGPTRKPGAVKCVVWDLDNTVWDGVLLEDSDVRLRPGVRQTIATLDERGILNSVASRNDTDAAVAKLTELGLNEFFLYPQISWNAKSSSIKVIADALNIGIDSLAFVDDQPFERDEVAHEYPEALCVDANDLTDLLVRKEFIPRFATEDSRHRRQMYLTDQVRKDAETTYIGPREEFLTTLDMRLEIAIAQESDLQRAEELTVRTSQLNTTGRTYSYDELDAFRRSKGHLLLITRLTDRYGPYGNIGLALVHISSAQWIVKLLLMSCRVMSRGVGIVLMNHIKRLARDAGVELLADFVHTSRNRMMFVSFKFNGFREVRRDGNHLTFQADLSAIPVHPEYIRVETS
jgi:FkbH-like protein